MKFIGFLLLINLLVCQYSSSYGNQNNNSKTDSKLQEEAKLLNNARMEWYLKQAEDLKKHVEFVKVNGDEFISLKQSYYLKYQGFNEKQLLAAKKIGLDLINDISKTERLRMKFQENDKYLQYTTIVSPNIVRAKVKHVTIFEDRTPNMSIKLEVIENIKGDILQSETIYILDFEYDHMDNRRKYYDKDSEIIVLLPQSLEKSIPTRAYLYNKEKYPESLSKTYWPNEILFVSSNHLYYKKTDEDDISNEKSAVDRIGLIRSAVTIIAEAE